MPKEKEEEESALAPKLKPAYSLYAQFNLRALHLSRHPPPRAYVSLHSYLHETPQQVLVVVNIKVVSTSNSPQARKMKL